MKKYIVLAAAVLIAANVVSNAKSVSVASPDGSVKITVSDAPVLRYSISVDGRTEIEPSDFGVQTDDVNYGGKCRILSVSNSVVDDTFTTPFYKKAEVRDRCNQAEIHFNGFNLIVRAYDDGCAWRFVSLSTREFKVRNEKWDVNFKSDSPAWINYSSIDSDNIQDQFGTSQENLYSHSLISGWKNNRIAVTPLLIEAGTNITLAESDVTDYPGLYFKGRPGSKKLSALFPPVPESFELRNTGITKNIIEKVVTVRDYIADCPAGFTFPWRIVGVNRTQASLMESDMVQRLAHPAEDTDWSWVKPGKVAWDWWCANRLEGVGFESGINTQTYKYFIDFAAEYGLEYVIMDGGWSVRSAADLMQVVPEIDLPEIVAYGKSRGVGIILWAGFAPFRDNMEEVCRHYAAMGVKGFKVDFHNRDDQAMMRYYKDAAETCAKYKLLIEFHGCCKPTGLQRTYPNVINFEAVFGLEMTKFHKAVADDFVTNEVTIPFTRMYAGPADYTPGAMKNVPLSEFRYVLNAPMSQGTRCRQIAEYIAFFAPLQMLCDSPTAYQAEPECTAFISKIPVVWDETLALDGKVGEYLAVARRKGDIWYVAAMNGWDPVNKEISLDFLPAGNYTLEEMKDDAGHVISEVKACDRLQISLSGGGGYAAIISPRKAEGYSIIRQSSGPDLGYSEKSGVGILYIDGLAFKDLNKNGRLDNYEDWRRSPDDRAKDLAAQLPVERICGLMLYSSAVDADSSALTREQTKYLKEDYIRHMLIRNVKDPATGAAWSNSVQAFCESEPFGIPSNNSTDPRNYTNGAANTSAYNHEPDGEFDPSGSSDISKWPREVGMAATLDPDLMRRHAEIVSAEYRALGITTALSPQADLSTDPRWRRFYGTFSEDPALNRDLVREYCDAMQTTPGSADGWGAQSVNCMVKHWPGGGTGEGGRDAHFGIGKYAVYPGNNFNAHLIPFVDGAFNLRGGTSMASAVMPYYTISTDQDPSGENVGNGFSKYIISDLLRDKYGFQGVVCTDWGIVGDYDKVYKHKGKPWGVETLSPAEKRLKCFEAGVDQLGGASDNAISIEAYNLWAQKYGDQSARARFEASAVRILKNIFRVGNFENPYVSPSKAAEIVGCADYVAAGYEAQLKSIVMIKNHDGVLPVARRAKVYQPLRKVAPAINHWQKAIPAYEEYPFGDDLLGKYFDIVGTPEEADFAIVSIKCPIGHWGYIMPDSKNPEGHYQPISLQYGPYTAKYARKHSIGAGDPTEAKANRSYRGYTETSFNVGDMQLVIDTKKAMAGKPVVVIVATDRPFVPAEIEPWSDAVLLSFGVSNNALLDIIAGKFEPCGCLPMQLPANMKTVEQQCEDVPCDMECYTDADGNSYDFTFGLNWSGVIYDDRVRKYRQ